MKEILSKLPPLPFSYSLMGLALFLMGWWSGEQQRSSVVVLLAQVVGVVTLLYTALALVSRRFSTDRDLT